MRGSGSLPFPKFEVEYGRPQTRVGGLCGEYREYRVVTFEDADGRQHEVWALVEFEMFSFRRIRLRAARTDGIPPSLREILENADAESGKAR